MSWPKECWVLVASDVDGGNPAVSAFLTEADARRSAAGMHGQAGYMARGITTHVKHVLLADDGRAKADAVIAALKGRKHMWPELEDEIEDEIREEIAGLVRA